MTPIENIHTVHIYGMAICAYIATNSSSKQRDRERKRHVQNESLLIVFAKRVDK